MTQRIHEEAVVLSTVDYGDADRVVLLFTRGHGRLSAFAHHARKSRRRFAGALEPTTALSVRLSGAGRELWRLEEVDQASPLANLRADLSLLSRGLYAVEVVRELTRDLEPHPGLFVALRDYLVGLDAGALGPTSLIAFELTALREAGLMPSFAPCAGCGGGLQGALGFDPDAGGVLCGGCTANARRPALAVRRELAESLAGIQRGERRPLSRELREEARSLLNTFIAHHLGRRLKSAEFMAQVGVD